jgi:hypothetical protein
VRDHVVDHQQAAGRERAHEVGPVARIGRPLGVEEHELPRGVAGLAQDVAGVGDAQVGVEPRTVELRARLLGARRVDLDADEPRSDGLGRVGQPQRRVAVGGAELEHPPRRERAHEHAEQLGRLRLEVAVAREPVLLRRVVLARGGEQGVGDGAAVGVHTASLWVQRSP